MLTKISVFLLGNSFGAAGAFGLICLLAWPLAALAPALLRDPGNFWLWVLVLAGITLYKFVKNTTSALLKAIETAVA